MAQWATCLSLSLNVFSSFSLSIMLILFSIFLSSIRSHIETSLFCSSSTHLLLLMTKMLTEWQHGPGQMCGRERARMKGGQRQRDAKRESLKKKKRQQNIDGEREKMKR